MLIRHWPVILVLVTASILVPARAYENGGVPADPVSKNTRQISEGREFSSPEEVIADPRDSGSGPEEPSEPWETPDQPASSNARFSGAKNQRPERRSKRNRGTTEMAFNDPMWDAYEPSLRSKYLDLNVDGAWRENVTGRGVVVGIIGTGVDKNHPDLWRSYNANASYDLSEDYFNPTLFDLNDGTRAAGLVVAAANNSNCIVGVAHGASFGDVTLDRKMAYERKFAYALNFASQRIDIYLPLRSQLSPSINGWSRDELGARALEEGANIGRGGKGSIFIFEAWQGGGHCSYNSYTNSMYTITLGGTIEGGKRTPYGSSCGSILAATRDKTPHSDLRIATIGPNGRCNFDLETKYSSSALAAGIIALTLEANPKLTWRDVQHIIVRTASHEGIDDPELFMNGARLKLSRLYGFGLMDAGAMVKLAKKWKTVPEQLKCEVPSDGPFQKLNASQCSHIRYLEHVEVVFESWRKWGNGYVDVRLHSPRSGSELFWGREIPRPYESSVEWKVMIVRHWGEKADGEWTLKTVPQEDGYISIDQWRIVFYGTSEPVNDDGDHGKKETNPSETSPATSTTTAPKVSPGPGDSTNGRTRVKPTTVEPPTVGPTIRANSKCKVPWLCRKTMTRMNRKTKAFNWLSKLLGRRGLGKVEG